MTIYVCVLFEYVCMLRLLVYIIVYVMTLLVTQLI
jgi:hypothetical protein